MASNTTKKKKVKQDNQSEFSYDYRVQIELTDQFNNVFFIDDINDNNTIKLKDGTFKAKEVESTDSTAEAPQPNNADADSSDDDEVEEEHINKKDEQKYINIFKDIYYIDSTVIQDLKTIFKKNITNITSDKYDNRVPIEIEKVKDLMSSTNQLAELHKIFTTLDYAKTIKDNIIHFNSGTYNTDRIKPINSTSTIEKNIIDNYKYISNTKKTSDFDDDEKRDALMFNNIMYLLKNIYLKKQTIIINVQKEKYYVNEILFYDLPYIHMVKKDYDNPRKVYIYLKVNTTPITDIPTIKIHYIIDDLEVSNLKLTAPQLIKPSDIDKDFTKYDTIYMFNKFKYKNEDDNMNAFFESLKNEKRVNKPQELFFNADIVSKYEKRYNNQNKNKKIDKAQKNNNVNANIIYLLREKFNLQDNKSSIGNNFIDDTYIVYNSDNTGANSDNTGANSDNYTYHSIMTNKKYSKYENPKKEQALKSIIKEHIKRFAIKFKNENMFYTDKRTDSRLNTRVYNIIIVFRTYKEGASKQKPTIMRRYVGEECLANAGTLDNIFSKLFYRTFGLPDKFLYDKFSNINEQNINSAESDASKIINPALPDKKGGKKTRTRKTKTKKTRTRKTRIKKTRIKK